MCHGAPVEVKRKLIGLGSLLPPLGVQESASGHQAWMKASLPAESPH